MKLLFTLAVSMLVSFSSATVFATEVRNHCFAEAQAAVISALSKHEILGKDLHYVHVRSVKVESMLDPEALEVIAMSTSGLNDGTTGEKVTISNWLVYSAQETCTQTTAELSSFSDMINRP